MATATELSRGKSFLVGNVLYSVARKELVNAGTHSHTKLKIMAREVIGDRERTFTLGHNEHVEIVDIFKSTATVIAKNPGSIQIMDSSTYETHDATGDRDTVEGLVVGDEVTYINYSGRTIIIPKKLN
ncbi:MAG: hypothetical protein KKF44_10100 [Nanoarchaeota archaeon]|nr:hypothetical protein [Nanoarchaeota archaeon]